MEFNEACKKAFNSNSFVMSPCGESYSVFLNDSDDTDCPWDYDVVYRGSGQLVSMTADTLCSKEWSVGRLDPSKE